MRRTSKKKSSIEQAVIILLGLAILYGLAVFVINLHNKNLMIAVVVLVVSVINIILINLFKKLGLKDASGKPIWEGYITMGGIMVIVVLAGVFLFNFLNQQSISIENSIKSDTFFLAGKIIDPATGSWNNDRLVLVFEKNKEVARKQTFRGEFPENGQGVLDGLFVIEVPNPYLISLGEFNYQGSPLEFSLLTRSESLFKKKEIVYYWFPEFTEGSSRSFEVPAKNLSYTVMVLGGDIATLPNEIRSNETELRDGFIFIAPQSTPSPDLGISGDYYLQNVAYKVNTENRDINKFTVPIDNCKSDQELHSPYSYTQTFVHKYSEQATTKAGVEIAVPELEWLKIVAELQKTYGFEDSQINAATVNYEMTAAPHTSQLYTVTWSEVWEQGIANIIKDNQSVSVPFEVKTNLIYAVTSETKACP